jgi:hypothetical protein
VFGVHFNPRGTSEDFERLVRWLQDLVRSASINKGDVRVGFYLDDQYPLFHLNQ